MTQHPSNESEPTASTRSSAPRQSPASGPALPPGGLGRWRPIEAVGAWLLPGLGHIALGQTRRGLIVAVTILTLWVGGLLIGGLGVINRGIDHAPFVWIGQYMMGPSLLVDLAHRRAWIGPDAGPLSGYHGEEPTLRYRPSFGRANEHGVLFTSVAGLLNLMAVLDVLYIDDRTLKRWASRGRRRRPSQRPASGPAGVQA